MDYLNSLLPTIEHFQALGYWIIFLIAILESLAFVGLFIPGTVFLVAVGALCAQGVLGAGDVIWFSAIGAIIGDAVSYFLGTRGKNLARRWERLITSSYMEHGERFLAAHGSKSVFLGRFIGPIRPIIPFTAGFFRMPPRQFFFWNILSAPCWATTYVCIGYFFGQAWTFTKLWTSRGSILLLSFLLLFILLYLLRWEILKRGREFFTFLRSLWDSISQAVMLNPDVQMLVRHHPVVFKFIRQRFDRRTFSGLPLSLLTIAFAYILILFLGLIEDLITADPIVGADVRIANLLYVFRDPHLTRTFTWITLLGKWQVIACFTALFSMILLIWRKTPYILPLFLTLAGSEIFDALGKMAFHRQRPDVALYLEKSFSFPSGHSTIAVAFYGFLLYFCWRQIDGYSRRLNLLFGGLIVILGIGFSRLYLGVHFLSDVWGGYLLGGLWLIIGMSMVEWQRARSVHTPPRSFHPGFAVKTATMVLVSAGICFYIGFGYHYVLPALEQPTAAEQVLVTDNIPGVFDLRRLPKYTETLSGENQEPLSFIMTARNDRQLVQAFQRSGWYEADSVDLASLARTTLAVFKNESYPTAPMTPSFWDSRVHDFGFERPTSSHSVRERHHARFWKSRLRTRDGSLVYVGTASLDKGFKWGITHKIMPDIDTEREYLLQGLVNTKVVGHYAKIRFVDPVMGRNFAGDLFFTDGSLYLVSLK